MIHTAARSPISPKIGQTSPFQSKQVLSQHNPKFQGNGLFNTFAEFDFIEAGKSTMRHNQFIYGACIVSRVLAASTRSWNEVREHALRDILGWTFWFYATPMLQRGFLKAFAPKDVNPLVLYTNKMPQGEGLVAGLKRLNWRLNPLAHWTLPSTGQLKERLGQTLQLMEKEMGVADPALLEKAKKPVVELFEKAVKWRNGASGFGLLVSIALLGIGIPLLNVWMTRRSVAAGHVGTHSAE